MRKVFALLMALVMVLGLTACTGDDGDVRVQLSIPQEVLDTPERNNAEFYPLKTDTTLRVLFAEDGQGANDASRLWEKTTGIKLDALTWTNEQMFTCLAAGDIPDAIVMPWNFSKAAVYEFASAGKFLDFSKHLSKMPNLCALIRQYPQILEVCAYPDGGMYSLPKVGWSNTYQSNLLYIRTDLMEELGWDKAPATTDELLQFVKDAQAEYGSNAEFVAFVPQSANFMNWEGMNTIANTLFPAFGDLLETGLTVDDEGQVVLGAATGQYRYYLEYMNQLWESGAFATEIYTMETTAARAMIQNGNCAISIGTYMSRTASSDGIAHVEALEPLTSRYQSEKRWRKIPQVNYRGCVANADCEDLDTLLAFLDSFYATENNPLNEEGTVWGVSMSRGELGVNWSINDETKEWATIGDFSNYSDNLYASHIEYTPSADLRIKGTQTRDKLLPYATETLDLSIMVLSQNDQDDFADLWVDLEKYISSMHAKFITGQTDIASGWDAYLEQLEKMNLQQVLDIYQKTYDQK